MEKIKIRILRDAIQIKFEESKKPIQDINKFIQYRIGPKKVAYITGHYQVENKKIPALRIGNQKLLSYEVIEWNRKGADIKLDFSHIIGIEGINQTLYGQCPETYINKMKVKAVAYKLEKYLIKLGYPIEVEEVWAREKYSEDRIMKQYKEGWHHKQYIEEGSSLKEIADRYIEAEKKNSSDLLDKNRKPLQNGEIKYFRDYKGHLKRGKVFHNLNNMWWVIINKYEYNNKANFDLFDLEETTILKRYKPRSRKSIIQGLESEYASYDPEISEIVKKFKDPYMDAKKLQKRFDDLHDLKRKIMLRIQMLTKKLEILDIEKFKKYRDNIEINNGYYHFNRSIIEKILKEDPKKVEGDDFRKLIQLLYPDKLVASGLFQPILIFKVEEGKRIDPPLEAYNTINSLIPRILEEALKVYEIKEIHLEWKKIKEEPKK